MRQLWLDRIASPLGELVLAGDGAGLCALEYADHGGRLELLLRRRFGAVELVPGAAPEGVREALAGYFAGAHASLDALVVIPGGTPFQQQVWLALRGIPPGSVRSYGELARELGRPGAARAVGLANSQNPLAIVVPCHRLVGAGGSLTGYAGGLGRKAWLLAHEGFAGRGVRPITRHLPRSGPPYD